jgi:Holliday junction resolvase
MVNSRSKGARGERAWRDVLKSYGINARRGRQFSGSPESPDVISDLTAIHWEVKWVERLDIYRALAQSIRDAGGNQIPIVAHKRNGTEWFISLRAKDFIEVFLLEYKKRTVQEVPPSETRD